MQLKKLLSQTVIYGASAIISKFLNYLLTPYLTRIMIDGVYGQVSLMYSVIPFLNVVLTMGLTTGYFKWAGKAETKEEKNIIFTSILKFTAIVVCIFFVTSSVFAVPIQSILGYGKPWYVIAVAALVAIDNINTVGLSGLRQEGKATYYMIINVFNVIINITVCFLLYTYIPRAKFEPGWVLIANIVASLFSTIMLAIWARNRISTSSTPLLKQILKFSIPLMLGGLMGISNDFIDKQMMTWLLPGDTAYASVGIYGAIGKIAALLMILRQIFTLGAEPFFLQKYSKDEFQKMNAEVLKWFLFVGCLATLLILYYLDYFLIIIGKDFRVGAPATAPLLISNLIMGLVISLSFWYKSEGKSKFAIRITVWGFVTIIIATLILIPRYGYIGAAYAQLASSLSMFIASYIYNQKYARTPYEIGKIIFYSILAVALYYLSLKLKVELSTMQYNISAIILLIMYALIFVLIEFKRKHHES